MGVVAILFRYDLEEFLGILLAVFVGMPVADDVHVVGNRGVDYGNGRIDGICGIGLIGIEHVARRVGSDCGYESRWLPISP